MISIRLIVFCVVLVAASCIDADINISGTSGSGLQVAMNANSGCPAIHQGGNSGMQLSVIVNGQVCSSLANTTSPTWSAIRRTKSNCPPINLINSSGLNIQVIFARGAQRYEGLDLRNKAGDQLSFTYDLGDCGVPDINMNGLSGSFLLVQGG